MMTKNKLFSAFSYLYCYPFYVYGLWRLSRLKKPIVTIFGGKKAHKQDQYYGLASQVAQKLIEFNYAVITGGGPGIMESALCGALLEGKKNTVLGIDVVGIDEPFVSACQYQKVFMHDFATRKKLLIEFSSAFICFPGGIGTLDEILEVLNLIKTKKLQQVPIILIGTEYWQFFLKWLEHAVQNNYIAGEYADLLFVTDDISSAINKIVNQ